jgi:DNA repair protein RecN (Recombination protein N)
MQIASQIRFRQILFALRPPLVIELNGMLTELAIRNFAIIDDLHITFGSGLNILTGETGAGKSIIIDAIGLLLGDRATSEWIRAGSEVASIEAQFALSALDELADTLKSRLEENGLDDPESPGWLVLSREVRANGRNICRINGRAASLQLLSEIAAALIDVHGQGEHLNLLRPSTHVHLLDRYGGLLDERRVLSQLATEIRTVRTTLNRLRQDARTIMQRVDILAYQTDEISQANLQPSEESRLDSERRRLGNAESLLQLAQSARSLLADGDAEIPGAIDLIGEAVSRMDRLARIDPGYAQNAGEAQTILEQLSELAASLQDYADNLEFNPAGLKEVEERLDLIHSLKRKYGDTIEDILAYGAAAAEELQQLSNWEIRTGELEQQEQDLLIRIGQVASDLSAKRSLAGETLAAAVEAELEDLRMEKARFHVSLTRTPNPEGAVLEDGSQVAFDATGIDRIEFLISANPGEPLKPLTKVASGGETARLMLALKGVLAHADATPTLVFDEIDQGIGGRVGGVVGRKLWALTGQSGPNAEATGSASVNHQVLCVTHLPQLAAYGDAHFAVTKRVDTFDGQERTTTVVRTLKGADRIDELALMLGSTSASGRQSVEEIMAEAGKAKTTAALSHGQLEKQ